MVQAKTCTKCGKSKPLAEFWRANGTRDGHRPECIQCGKALRRQWYLANREKVIEKARRWQNENPERFAESQRKRRARPDVKRQERARHLRRKYGFTLEAYEALLAEQDGACAICRREAKEGGSLHVDHHHDSGAVRGLLCFDCNAAVGLLKDDPDLIRAALRYVTGQAA